MRQALRQVLFSDPIDQWARGSIAAWDFTTGVARWNYARVGRYSATPGLAFTRASTGYADDLGGRVLSFASGQLRRIDGRGALIEGARTNSFLQSQTFQTSWAPDNLLAFGSGSTVDAIAAPDGTTTADLITEDSTAATFHRLVLAIAVTNAPWTMSVYAKAGTRNWISLQNATDAQRAWFDLTNGVVGTQTSCTGTIRALANGWYRCSMTCTPASAASKSFGINIASADNTTNYNGDGASGLYIWGAQLELGAHVSSYIPTTTASATRAADSITITGVTGLDYPLTLFAEFERAVDTGGAERIIGVSDNSTNNRAEMFVGATDTLDSVITAGGAAQGNPTITGALSVGTVYKGALRIAANDAVMARSGSVGTADTSITLPSAPTTIHFGAGISGATPSFGWLRKAAIWMPGQADSQLQDLTR